MKKELIIEEISMAYEERNPELSHTLFFVHSNSGSSKLWSGILDNAAFSGYRMIAIDLPAHGNSSASEAPEQHYGLLDLGRIVAKMMLELAGNGNFIAIGISLGTNIIAEALNFVTPMGLILLSPMIAGAEVSIQSISKPGVNPAVLFIENAAPEAVHQFFSLFPFSKDPVLLNNFLEDYFKVKAPFRSVMINQTMSGKASDEILLLKNTRIPVLFIMGEEDELIDTAYLDRIELNKWNDTIFKIPAAGHFVPVDQQQEFASIALEYINFIFREYAGG